MVIERLRIDDDLTDYLLSKDDVEKFINFCIRERKDVLEKDFRKNRAMPAEAREKRKVDADFRTFADEVANLGTPFFHKNVVITGTFARYEDRNELAELLWAHGAAIKSGINSKTEVVVVGSGAGPKKLEVIKELKAGGQDITIISEAELYDMLAENEMV